jgi:hypothetical protein
MSGSKKRLKLDRIRSGLQRPAATRRNRPEAVDEYPYVQIPEEDLPFTVQ